jgi:hypothetical protein
LDETLAHYEWLCNRADRIPGISVLSGGLRFLAGHVQMVAASALSFIELTYILLTARSYPFRRHSLGLYYFLHGAANVYRGGIAMEWWTFPLFSLYDRYIGRANYFYEPRSAYYPLNHRCQE